MTLEERKERETIQYMDPTISLTVVELPSTMSMG